MTQALRHLRLVGATSGLRTATYDGREHLVTDVVAMVEGVVWAVNSEYPEFVPAEELAETPQQWNGRGCFAGHPKDGDSQVTANTPRTLETSFGVVFDAASREKILETRRLQVAAYLDPKKAEAVGVDAVDVIRRLRAGETVEVSVGCYIEPVEVEGEWNGKPYVAKWTNIVSDHLAFLAAGEQGACSVEAGCGAPRTAVRHLVGANGLSTEDVMPEVRGAAPAVAPDDKKQSLRERLAAVWKSAKERMAQEGMGDRELRYKLYDALRAVEPGFSDVEDVYQDEGVVIYYVMPEDEWYMKRRSYSVDAVGAVTLGNDAVRVEPKTTYEVVAARSSTTPTVRTQSAQRAASCGCGQPQPSAPKEGTMKDATKTLITGSNGRFTDADAAWLDAVPEDRLKALAAPEPELKKVVETPAPPAETPKPVESPAVAAAKPLTQDEAFAAFPDVAAIVAEHKTREAAEKAALVEGLKAAAAGTFTEDELKAKSVAELRQLSALAKVEPAPDFSGRAFPRAAAEKDDFTPPDSYAAPKAAATTH